MPSTKRLERHLASWLRRVIAGLFVIALPSLAQCTLSLILQRAPTMPQMTYRLSASAELRIGALQPQPPSHHARRRARPRHK